MAVEGGGHGGETPIIRYYGDGLFMQPSPDSFVGVAGNLRDEIGRERLKALLVSANRKRVIIRPPTHAGWLPAVITADPCLQAMLNLAAGHGQCQF
jgi:hypothetical protein